MARPTTPAGASRKNPAATSGAGQLAPPRLDLHKSRSLTPPRNRPPLPTTKTGSMAATGSMTSTDTNNKSSPPTNSNNSHHRTPGHSASFSKADLKTDNKTEKSTINTGTFVASNMRNAIIPSTSVFKRLSNFEFFPIYNRVLIPLSNPCFEDSP